MLAGFCALVGLLLTGTPGAGAQAPPGTALVTGFTPSALRNDFDGWVGMRIQGGATDISVTSLGRWVVTGNTQSHPVRLVRASTGADVATATVATSGQPPAAFAFTTLASPVTLLANTTYYLLSQEFAGGDTWYDYTTSPMTTSAASGIGTVWASTSTPSDFNPGGSANQAYGVPNLRYTTVDAAPAISQQPANVTVTAGTTVVFTATASGVPTPTVQWQSKASAAPSFTVVAGATSTTLTIPNVGLGSSGTQYRAVFSNAGGTATTNAATLTVNASPPAAGEALVTSFTPSALRNDFDGWVGMRLQVGASNLSVGSLGRWVVSGNDQSHPLRLVTTTGTVMATATVDTAGQPAGAFAFAALGAPVTLTASTTYYLQSQEFLAGDTWYDYNTAVVTTSAASDTGVVWSTTSAPGTYNAAGAAGQSYGVPNLRYTVINSAPTDIALTATSIAENLAIGTTVGTLSTTDIDGGDTHAYTLVAGGGDGDNGSFEIVGTALKTKASFDFETKSSYAIRIRTTDSGSPNAFFEEPFTITVTNMNDAPTDIALNVSSVAENSSVNTVVGTLSATDQDVGQTRTFTLVGGAGGTDNASFNISGTSLRTSASFNFEVKNSYAIRVRVTDNGTPNLFFDEQFTIAVTDVNDAPVAVADSYGATSPAIGNTLFVLNAGGTGPKLVVTGSVVTANDTDEDGDTLSAVAEPNVASTGGGSATIAANGNFTFLPGVGDKSQVDTFPYKVTDGTLTTNGTVSVTIGADRAWYVDNALGTNGDGRSSSPFNTLASLRGTDPDDAGDYIFVFQGSGSYAGGLPLENNQRLIGQPEGFAVGATTLLAASPGPNPTITNNAPNNVPPGAGITLAQGNTIRRVNVSNTSGSGITGQNITTTDIGPNMTVSGAAGAGFTIFGTTGTTGNITFAANVTHSSASGRSVFVGGRSAGTVTISGAITDTAGGVQFESNTGATINVPGALSIATTANEAFRVTGGGTVNVTGTTNTLSSAGGTALTFTGTTIGSSGLTFQSIAKNGGTNSGILLNGTGSGPLTVTGTGGPPATAGSGGTVQNTTGDGISLTNVGGVVSLNGMVASNVTGTDVLISGGGANVTFAGTITNQAAKGRSINVSNKTGGTVLFSGAISDSGDGINLATNAGATVNFTGGLTLSTGTAEAFVSTGGGTVNVTGSANTIVTTTARALRVENTTIGGSGLTFRSITAGTAAGGPVPVNGITLNNTGSSGGLTVTGTGAANSGGTIQRTSGPGVSLTSTRNPSFNNLQILNTGNSGIHGTRLTNFTFTNGRIDNSGTALGVDNSSIGLNTTGTGTEQNVTGTVIITGNTLTNAYYQGIDIFNYAGTIGDATISNNTITSSTSTATSKGSGIRFVAFGGPTAVASITKATLDNNAITNFPSGVGLQVQCGNANSPTASPSTCGTPGNATNIINITNNDISGQSAANRLGAEGLIALVGGRGQGNFNISGNDVRNMLGTAISHSAFGFATVTSTISNNTVVANNTVGSQGIGVGTSLSFTAADTPSLTTTITGNNISQTDGNGILAVARDANGTLRAKIQNNIVAAPLAAVRPGIRVDSGNSNGNATVCLNISGNTSGASGGHPGGIGLRKQTGVPTTNAFGVNGMTATATPGVESYVNGLNPAGAGTLLISATSGFTNCPLP